MAHFGSHRPSKRLDFTEFMQLWKDVIDDERRIKEIKKREKRKRRKKKLMKISTTVWKAKKITLCQLNTDSYV